MLCLAIFLAGVVQAPSATATDTQDSLLPVCISGRWGYIQPDGELVIPCNFELARRFHDGRAAVKIDDLWQFIDASGALAFNGSWREVGDFSEGLAAVIFDTGVGYLNTDGEVALKFGLANRLPSDFYGGKASFSFPMIGVSVLAKTISRVIDRDGASLFELEGVLSRIPGGFVHQAGAGENRFTLLDDVGKALHEGWFSSVGLPKTAGPIPVQRDGTWEYFDVAGAPTITAKFNQAFAFGDGLAAARVEDMGSFGFIGRDGNWKIKPQFTFAGDFENGYAMVKIGDSVCWINAAGEMIWSPQNYPVQDWERKVASERTGEKVGELEILLEDEPEPLTLGEVVGIYRNRNEALARARVRYGAEVIFDAGRDSETHFVYAVDLSWFFRGVTNATMRFLLVEDDLRAAVQFARRGDLEETLNAVNTSRIYDDVRLFHLLERDAPNLSGQLKVKAPEFFECGSFGEPTGVELHIIGGHDDVEPRPQDLLPMPYAESEGKVTFWSPVTFETAFAGVFEDARAFSEGLAAVRKDGLYGFIDLEGKWVIRPQFQNTSAFHEGVAVVVQQGTSLLGAVDRNGNMALPFQFQSIGDFHQGRARIVRDEKWGFIDRSGNEIIAAEHEWTGDFASGMAPFKSNELCGYLNLNGEVVVAATYRTATTHVEGLATAVGLDENMHYLDHNGDVVISGQFLFASDFLDGVALVQDADDGGWRLIDRTGETHARVETVQ